MLPSRTRWNTRRITGTTTNIATQYLPREFAYGNYEQSYTLPDDVDRDKISAGVANGILTITIPKTTPEQEAKVMRNIEVK